MHLAVTTKVAFIIPTKNESANIDGVLDSILAQLGIEPEIVVVDNGSTDDTVARASKRNIKIVHCEGRVSDCRMAGASSTDASILFFVDADQRLEPETTQRALRELADPAVSAVVIPERPYKPRTWFERLTGVERETLEASGRGIPRIFRRGRYAEIGGHPTGIPFGEDYALLSRLEPEEVRVADAVIYHQEVARPAALLKKYFAYGKQMATSPNVGPIFTDRAGSFIAQVIRLAVRSPSSAIGVLTLKCAKLVALRLGYADGVLESRSGYEQRALPSEGQWFFFTLLALLVSLGMNWRMIATPGILMMGDHVSPRPDYWQQILGAWNQFEHGGTANANLIASPYFILLGLLERLLGVGAGDKVLIVLFFSVAILSTMVLLVRVLRLDIRASFLIGIFYAFNPWSAARITSGHTELLMAYAVLPLFVVTWQTPSIRSVLLTALGIAVLMCLSLPIALLAVVALLAFSSAHGGIRRSLRDAAIAVALAIGMNLWWILPLLSTHGGRPGHTGLENVLSYTQLADVAHTITFRSYWWPPVSDGLYRYDSFIGNLLVIFGMAALVAAEIAILLSWRRLSAIGRAGVTMWLTVSLVLILAHVFPWAYWQLLRVPVATFFRDPDKLVPLSLLGLIVAFADVARRFTQKGRSGFAIACVAIACVALPWWSSGDLRGTIRPLAIRDGSLAAADWISRQQGNRLVLWWPNGPYVRYRWYPAGGQDPLRSWTTDPMLNPYYDPAYDATPRTSDFLYALVDAIPKHNVPYLGALLSTYGIRFVAVRNYASTSFTDFPDYRPDFDSIRDLRRVRVFGDTDVYENLAWRQGFEIIGHYDAMLTGDPIAMLSLDPEMNANEIFFEDGIPSEASYEYLDIDRQLERALLTYRHESNAPYDVVFSADATPSRELKRLALSCPACDVLMVRTNAVRPRIVLDGSRAAPLPLYADLPGWEPRWRAYAIGNARTISVSTGDPNAYVYEAVTVSRRDLDRAIQISFDEVRHHWPTYIANAGELDMRHNGSIVRSDRLGPIVETDTRKWRAVVVGRRLASVALTFYWWNGGARQKIVPLRCAPQTCSGVALLDPGFQRVEVTATRGETIQGLIFSSGRPPQFDNARVDAMPARIDPHTRVFVPVSYSPGWLVACADGMTGAEVGNDWATLFFPRRSVVHCTQRYWPDSMTLIGAVLSLLALGAVIASLVLADRLPVLRSASYERESFFETPV